MAHLTDVTAFYECENLNDSHNSNNLSKKNNLTHAAFVLNNGIVLDGTTANAVLAVTAGGGFTIGTSDFDCILAYRYGAGDLGAERNILGLDNGDWTLIKRTNETFQFRVNTDGALGFVNHPTVMTNGTIYFVRVYRTGQTIGIDLDNSGSPTTKSLNTDTPLDRNTNFRVGTTANTPNGEYDNIVIREGSNWSASELTDFYNGGSLRTYAQIAALDGGGIIRSDLKLSMGLRI